MSAPQFDSRLEFLRERVQQWHGAFTKSGFFSELDQLQQSCSLSIVVSFAENAYTFLGLFPDEWDEKSTKICCSELLPRKEVKGGWYFESVAPVLNAFFRYLWVRGILTQGSKLARAAQSVEFATLINSENPCRWGPAKTFAMEARQAGLDLRESHALDLWCDRLNRQLISAPLLPQN
jgi:hypothetical protein